MAAEREGIPGNLYASCLERSIPVMLEVVYSLFEGVIFLGEVLNNGGREGNNGKAAGDVSQW